MAKIALISAPTGNGHQGTIPCSRDVSVSSAETLPTLVEAISAAAIKMFEMPERVEEIDRSRLAG